MNAQSLRRRAATIHAPVVAAGNTSIAAERTRTDRFEQRPFVAFSSWMMSNPVQSMVDKNANCMFVTAIRSCVFRTQDDVVLRSLSGVRLAERINTHEKLRSKTQSAASLDFSRSADGRARSAPIRSPQETEILYRLS
jgi:hypothetical protein